MKRTIGYLKGLFLIVMLVVAIPVTADNYTTINAIKRSYKELLILNETKEDPLLKSLIQITPETEVSDQIIEQVISMYPFNKESIKRNIETISEKGQWPEIDYKDTKQLSWEPQKHMRKIFELSRVLHSPLVNELGVEKVEQTIHCALNYWFTNRPKSDNWWYNEIGIPMLLGETMLLFENQLTKEEFKEGIKILKQVKIHKGGQKKVVLAGNVLLRGLLENKYNIVKEAHDSITSEIIVGKKDGIQNDWSFHQNGPIMQFGNSGLSYLGLMNKFYKIFKNTEFEFNETQTEILESFIDNGFQWCVWKRNMDVNALGRQLCKNSQFYKGHYLAMMAKGLGKSSYPATTNPLIGHKHFSKSDYTVHRTADWMASVKMSSNHVYGTERFNEENIYGLYISDGATCFYMRGDEYENIFPLMDWRKIPGVTAHEDIKNIPNTKHQVYRNETDLVGGISFEANGMTAMALNKSGLKGFKSWFFTDNYILCLGAGIKSDSLLCVTTTIDQRNQRGPLVVHSGRKWKQISNQEFIEGKDIRFFHDNTGYIVINKSSCIAKSEHREGQWHDVMKLYSPKKIEGDIVSLHINHGASPRNEKYAYIVLPATNPKDVSSFNLNDIEIVKNDSQAQIIREMSKKDTYWMAVYQPVRLNLRKKSLSIYKPGVYCMIFKNKRFTTIKSYEFD